MVKKGRISKEKWSEIRKDILKRDNYLCTHCGKSVTSRSAHIDHIVAVAQGGTNLYSNLRTLCKKCHYLRDDPSHVRMRKKAIKGHRISKNDKLWR